MEKVALPTHGRKSTTRKRQVAIPLNLKKSLGISVSALTVQAALESLPEVQHAIQKLSSRVGAPEASCVAAKVRGGATHGVPHYLLQERNKRIIELHQMGLTPETIRKHMNSRAEVTGWGKLAWEGSVSRIVSNYFQKQKPSAWQLEAQEEGMREAMFSSMAHMIEQLSLYIARRNQQNNWAKFEFAAAMGSLFRMCQSLVDNRNWNASRMNPCLVSNTNVLFPDEQERQVTENRRLLQPVIDLLDECLAQSAETNNQ